MQPQIHKFHTISALPANGRDTLLYHCDSTMGASPFTGPAAGTEGKQSRVYPPQSILVKRVTFERICRQYPALAYVQADPALDRIGTFFMGNSNRNTFGKRHFYHTPLSPANRCRSARDMACFWQALRHTPQP